MEPALNWFCSRFNHRTVGSEQSSLNAEEGMGVASLSVIYASIIISSMFLPPIMIKNLGCKWTIVVGMACYVSYSFGNLYPGWYPPSLTFVLNQTDIKNSLQVKQVRLQS